MLLVAIDDVEPGMVLGVPVKHPKTGKQTLLRSGFALTHSSIHKLSSLGVRALWIHHPGLEFLDKHLGSEVPESRAPMLDTIKKHFTKTAESVSTQIPIGAYRDTVSGLIKAMLGDKHHAVHADRLAGGNDELFEHCSNVAYLSLVVGLKMRAYIAAQRARLDADKAQDLTNLGIGAMMHDLGKTQLDDDVRALHIFDDKAQHNPAYQAHVQEGYQLAHTTVEPSAAQVLLNHHQRWDGEGFPVRQGRPGKGGGAPLKADQIHVFSRIVAVADTYDALMVSDKSASPAQALYRLQSADFDGWFDPEVLTTFLRIVPPFPLGSVVALSDQRRAAVINLNNQHPCRPKVRIMNGSEEALDIDLSEEAELRVAIHRSRPVSEYDYSLPSRSDALANE